MDKGNRKRSRKQKHFFFGKGPERDLISEFSWYVGLFNRKHLSQLKSGIHKIDKNGILWTPVAPLPPLFGFSGDESTFEYNYEFLYGYYFFLGLSKNSEVEELERVYLIYEKMNRKIYFLTSQNIPCQVPLEQMFKVYDKEENLKRAKVLKQSDIIQVKDKIRVCSGPLKDFIGLCIFVRKEKLQVRIPLFKRETDLWVDRQICLRVE